MTSAAMYLKLEKMQNKNNREERAFNKQEAATAREFEKMMSDTAHQREVADLKAAGLNPMLSVNDGANSYTAASASADTDSAANAVANAYGAVTSAAATRAAATESAAATRAAAASNYAAAQYAANKQYELGVYQANMRYKIEMDKPQNSLFGVADKYASKATFSLGSVASKFAKQAKNLFTTLSKHTTPGRRIGIKDVSKMSKSYKAGIDTWLKYNNIKVNDTTRALAYNYISNGGNKSHRNYYRKRLYAFRTSNF